MQESVQYNDFDGTASADISDIKSIDMFYNYPNSKAYIIYNNYNNGERKASKILIK